MKKCNAVVEIQEDDENRVWMSARSPDGKHGLICLNFLGPQLCSQAFVGWARERLKLAEAGVGDRAYLTARAPARLSELPPLTEDEIQKVWETLTNGVGALPKSRVVSIKFDEEAVANGYCEAEEIGGEDRLAVTVEFDDGAELCDVYPVRDPAGYEETIAWAICQAGRAIRQLRVENDDLRAQLVERRPFGDEVW